MPRDGMKRLFVISLDKRATIAHTISLEEKAYRAWFRGVRQADLGSTAHQSLVRVVRSMRELFRMFCCRRAPMARSAQLITPLTRGRWFRYPKRGESSHRAEHFVRVFWVRRSRAQRARCNGRGRIFGAVARVRHLEGDGLRAGRRDRIAAQWSRRPVRKRKVRPSHRFKLGKSARAASTSE